MEEDNDNCHSLTARYPNEMNLLRRTEETQNGTFGRNPDQKPQIADNNFVLLY